MSKQLVSSLDGDNPCDDCGTQDNIIWFTDNTLWNRVCRADGRDYILCILCFVKRAEARGCHPVSWQLLPNFSWAEEEATI